MWWAPDVKGTKSRCILLLEPLRFPKSVLGSSLLPPAKPRYRQWAAKRLAANLGAAFTREGKLARKFNLLARDAQFRRDGATLDHREIARHTIGPDIERI